MCPEVPIVDCGPLCAVGFSRTIDKSEFSHSLGRYRSSHRKVAFGVAGVGPGSTQTPPQRAGTKSADSHSRR